MIKRLAALLFSAALLLATPAHAVNGELEGAFAPPGYTGAQLHGAYCPCQTVQYTNFPGGAAYLQAGADILNTWLHNNTPTYVIAHSEGAQVVDLAISQHPNDPAYQGVTFVLTGNPDNKYNGMHSNQSTFNVPENTGYDILVVTRQYDGAADFPNDTSNGLAVLNAYAGMLFVHPFYNDVNINDPANATWTSGGVNYVVTPTYPVPLLQPLAWLPPSILEPWDKSIRDAIEPAYTAAPRPAYPTYTTIPNTTTTQEISPLTSSNYTQPQTFSTTSSSATTQTVESSSPASSVTHKPKPKAAPSSSVNTQQSASTSTSVKVKGHETPSGTSKFGHPDRVATGTSHPLHIAGSRIHQGHNVGSTQ